MGGIAKILIVDDEEDLLEVCADAFEFAGHQVRTALNVTQALKILETDRFDAIISDSNMPDMSGEEFLAKIHKDVIVGQKTQFYLATGAIDVNTKLLEENGASGVVTKPFDIDELIERIAKGTQNAKA